MHRGTPVPDRMLDELRERRAVVWDAARAATEAAMAGHPLTWPEMGRLDALCAELNILDARIQAVLGV